MSIDGDAIVLDLVDEMVTDAAIAAIARSMFYLWERMKMVVEPTGALAATAILEGIVSQPGARIGVVVSGGNAATKRPWIWELS